MSTQTRRGLRVAGVVAVLILLAVELALGWSSLAGAFRQLRAPHVGWLALAVLAEVAAMGAYARMQRHFLRSAGVRAPLRDHVRLAYAAHALNETLPGGPAFSIPLNYQQMRRFGAAPAVASWAIALSGIFSASALAVLTASSAYEAGGGEGWLHLVVLLLGAVGLTFGVRHVATHPDGVVPLVRRPLALVNRLRRKPADHGVEQLNGFIRQLRAARLTLAHGLAAAGMAMLNWLFDAGCLWLCFRALGVHPAGTWQVLLVFCAAMAAGTVTIVPGGIGIVDSALILGLVAGGVATPSAVAVVVLYRILSGGFIRGVGWLAWLGTRHQPPISAIPAQRSGEEVEVPRTLEAAAH
jgi:uncharacterized membrane protein YbhN (UPF0104 family)